MVYGVGGVKATKYKWVLGSKLSHCPDCSGRAGEVKTRLGWRMVGGPGMTVCGDACECRLEAVNEVVISRKRIFKKNLGRRSSTRRASRLKVANVREIISSKDIENAVLTISTKKDIKPDIKSRPSPREIFAKRMIGRHGGRGSGRKRPPGIR